MQRTESPQSMRRRTALLIVANVLEACRPGAKRTQILYKANLSFEQLNRYLALLVRSKLIYHDEGNKLYRVTERGREFLTHYCELENASRVFEGNRKILLEMLDRNEPLVAQEEYLEPI